MSKIKTTYHVWFREKEFGCICENNQDGYEDLELARNEFEYEKVNSNYVRLTKQTEEVLDTYEKPKEKPKYKQISGIEKVIDFIKNCDGFDLCKIMCVCPMTLGLKDLYKKYPECRKTEEESCVKCWEYALKNTYEIKDEIKLTKQEILDARSRLTGDLEL
jgi:hypothetical protein